MDDRSVFHLISDVTHEEGVSCVLIGGFFFHPLKVAPFKGTIYPVHSAKNDKFPNRSVLQHCEVRKKELRQ